MSRWEKILDEATKRSGAGSPPLIVPPQTLDLDPNIAPNRGSRRCFPLRQNLFRNKRPGAAAIAIGPEGDWSPSEAELLLEKGFKPVSLGSRILRASTAVAVACGWFSMK